MTRLTGRDIAEIARLLDDSRFATLDLTMGDFRLKIRRDGGAGEWADDDRDEGDETPPPRDRSGPGVEPEPDPAPTGGGTALDEAAGEGEVDVEAPLLGNFYAAPRPGEDPFVSVGDRVGEDSVIGIIEVMKLMNSVRSGVAGTVVAVLAENGKAVEQGQALVRVRLD